MKTSKCFKLILREGIRHHAHYPECPWFICFLADAFLDRKSALKIKRIMRGLLGNDSACLVSWLTKNGYLGFRPHTFNVDLTYSPYNDPKVTSKLLQKLHNTRVAWLEHLISHYESIGD